LWGDDLQALLKELQRRNVFRIASIYAVGGWLLMQLAVVLETTLNLPGWFDTLVTVLVLIGFPIVVFGAWAFEMTADGLKPTAGIDPDQSITATTGKRLDMVLAGAAVVLIFVIIGDRVLPSNSAAASRSAVAPEDFSIAVLPFADMSPDGDQEYFADGISEELLNVMAQVPDLAVAGRTSSFAFKGQNRDLREIAEILDVAHVLEGSVRKSGNKVRVTAQLIRANNGFHMWSDTYDGELTDIFAVQDQIANEILTALKPQLLGTVTPIAAPRTDISAYDLYLLAQQKANLGTLAGFEDASEALDKALAIDPDFVPALAWRGYYELMMSDGDGAAGDIPIEVALERADQWTSRALALDPQSADALFARAGWMSMTFDGETRDKAGAVYERALAIKPNFALARNDYGYWLNDHERFEEAAAQFEIALVHDPAQTDVNTNLAAHYGRKGQFDKVRDLASRWAAISPENPGPLFFLSISAFRTGNLAEGLRLQRKVMEMAPDDPRAERGLRFAELDLGEYDLALKADQAFIRYRALLLLGRKAEAIALAEQELEARPDFPMQQSDTLQLYYDANEWPDIVRYYDATWSSVDAFVANFPRPPYHAVLPALTAAGHPDAPEMHAAARDAIDIQRASGFQSAELLAAQAQLAALEGDQAGAMAFLETAFDNGNRDMTLFIDPVLNAASSPRFNVLLAKTGEAINAERAKLGLPAIEMPEPYK
jgi:TolB-like protein/Tfp pilus assembly protein PilF